MIVPTEHVPLTKSAKRRARFCRVAQKACLPIDRSQLLVMRVADIEKSAPKPVHQLEYPPTCNEEIETKLVNLRKTCLGDAQELITEAIGSSLQNFAWHVERQFKQYRDRIEALEASIARMESCFPTEYDKQAFLDLPACGTGTPSSILERQCQAVKTIQTSWRAFLGWTLGKACAARQAEKTEQDESMCATAIVDPLCESVSAPAMNETGAELSMEEFRSMAQLVRRRLPHIPEIDPPMLMLCDGHCGESEACRNADDDAPEWGELWHKKRFDEVWESLVAENPSAPPDWIAKEATARLLHESSS